MLGTPYGIEYAAFCLIQHGLFALLCSLPVCFLIWTIFYRGRPGRRTWPSLYLLGAALGATSHWFADAVGMWF